MPIFLGRLAPVVLVGEVVNRQCPSRGYAVGLGVVMGRGINGGPGGEYEVAVVFIGDMTLTFAREAQARSQARYAGEMVFKHATQNVLRYVDWSLTVQSALNRGVFTFGI